MNQVDDAWQKVVAKEAVSLRARDATRAKGSDAMTTRSPLIKLNNGVEMPALGLGVLGRETLALTSGAVQIALDVGYRLIDTAASYLNERDVGEALARSGVPRDELFVTTKLWLTDYGYDRALRAFDASLRKLGLKYIDLYLLHWPLPSDFESTVGAYRAAETLLAEGRVRAIGVSNFGATHLANLLERAKVTPAVNQVELHPRFIQRDLRDVHASLGIVTQAWSPLAGSLRRFSDPNKQGDPLEHPTVIALASKYGKTPAQVVLRWHIDHGFSAIPKSFHRGRIASNFDIFDFSLTKDEMASIDALDAGARSGPDPEVVTATTFAIKVEG
jgi:diketogulonate reductase-like aldo/keto reductase